MPKTVDAGFQEFHSRFVPLGGESNAAKNHRASIEACLKANFRLTRFFRTGSVGNSTSIRNYSDVDYFASIPTEKLKNSQSTLREMKEALANRFPNTGVTVRTPAILVPFGTSESESTEVVPADCVKVQDGHLVYDIPSRVSGWIKSSPDAHNSYVTDVNKKLGKKVKPLIRFLKAWKYYKNVPITSFYLEIRVAKFAAGESSIIYSWDVKSVLEKMLNLELAAVRDPMGIAGNILPCSSDVKKEDALSKLQTAVTRAQKARAAESNGSIVTAFDWWNLVFDGKFPAYG